MTAPTHAENGAVEADAPLVWVLTDGKIGDEVQCVAIAAALAPDFERRVVAPRAPWVWMAPWGPVDPREAPGREGGPLSGLFPDLAIVSGRRAIPHARALKKASAGRTKIVVLKDPRAGRSTADALWAPAHDRISGANVISTLTSPHGLSAALNSETDASSSIAQLTPPLLGVVLGGPAGGADYSASAAREFAQRLNVAGRDFASIAITPSRRTPPPFLAALTADLRHDKLFVWDGDGENPYTDMLKRASALVVAGDSHNMVSEALAARSGVYVWRPRGLAEKMGWFIDQLIARGDAKEFENAAGVYERTPQDATLEIVAEIKKLLGR
ncbi:mitochondrial fission ELM1 family protein [Hyphococcus sp.]|uniref:mitochondrial fission ELM1 family protein n=1 Tax=Hyphococcus sp. TaxID=2038636 RepID=UPI0020825106|nr:MAG: nucleoside-diphosphate sugar epimerase [Marinicaulis sp.]